MNLEDCLKIATWSVSGFIFGGLTHLAVNGAPAFASGASPERCFEIASQGGGKLYYIIGGAVAVTLAAMWYYDKWPLWIYNPNDDD